MCCVCRGGACRFKALCGNEKDRFWAVFCALCVLCAIFLYSCLFVEDGGQRGDNVPATSDLFLGFFEYAVHELEMHPAHPLGATLRSVAQAAVEVEGCADGNHNALLEMWLQTVHEYLLLGCSQSYPYDVGSVALYLLGYAGIVELVDGAER